MFCQTYVLPNECLAKPMSCQNHYLPKLLFAKRMSSQTPADTNANDYLHAPHDKHQHTILVTLPDEIHKEYQSCVLASEEYNNRHSTYLQS